MRSIVLPHRAGDDTQYFKAKFFPETVRGHISENTSLQYSREFVTKPQRRHARRVRGAAKEGSILETVC